MDWIEEYINFLREEQIYNLSQEKKNQFVDAMYKMWNQYTDRLNKTKNVEK